MASRISASAVRAVVSTSAISVAARAGIAGDEAAGEFGFEDDDGEGVAKDVVEVAGDAFALGDGGEGDVFFKGGAEFAIGAALLGEVDVAAADDDDEEDGDEGVGPANVEVDREARRW